jgi:hypothetical protein
MAADASSSSQDAALFKCTCQGENSNCFRCHGTGWCEKPVLLRSGGVRLPPNPNPDRKRKKVQKPELTQTAIEKRYARQVNNEMPKLRSLFLEQVDFSPRPYVEFLIRLMITLHDYTNFHSTEFRERNLKAIAKNLKGWRTSRYQPNRIVADAAHACLLDYERALEKKSQLPPKPPPTEKRKSRGADTCLHCGIVFVDLQLHNRVAHPSSKPQPARATAQEPILEVTSPPAIKVAVNAPAAAPASPHAVLIPEKKATAVEPVTKVAATIIRPIHKKLECPHCGASVPSNRLASHIKRTHQTLVSDAGAKNSKQGKATGPNKQAARAVGMPNVTGRKKSPSAKSPSKQSKSLPTTSLRNRPPPSGPDAEFSRDRADTQGVEQAMDARRTWGGRYRDTNGTFGSYPLHDNMDDESDAG